MKIYIDADACPRAAKEIIYKKAEKRIIEVILVANQFIRTPESDLFQSLVVSDGFDAADDKIVELCEEGDLVITADIPLADRVVKKGAFALNSRGQLLDERNISNRLATRNLMDELRSSGIDTGGPPPYNERNKQEFNNALDRFLTRHHQS